MGTFGAVAAITALPAYAQSTVTTSTYTIGSPSGAVADVTATPTSVTTATSNGYEVTFEATSALSGTTPDDIVISTSSGTTFDGAVSPDNIELIDSSSSTCFQNSGPGGTLISNATDTGFEVTLSSACSIAAGNTVQVDFTAFDPASTGTFTLGVTTDLNGTTASSNAITVTSVPPTLSAGVSSIGTNTTYTIDDAGASTATDPWTTLTAPVAGPINAIELDATPGDIAFYSGGAGGYSVTYTPSGGTAVADTVASATIGATTNIVYLALDTDLASGGTVNITAVGQNVADSPSISITPGNYTAPTFTPATGAVTESAGPITFGTAVSAVTVSPSPAVAGAEATYTVNFKASSEVTGGGYITLAETAGATNFSTQTGVLVTDNNSANSWHYVATGITYGSGVSGAGAAMGVGTDVVEIPVPVGETIDAGDTITVLLGSVTNPATNGTYSDFTVYTNADPLGAAAASYSIGASGSAGVTVAVSPSTPSSTATYTISNLYAGSAGLPADTLISLTASATTTEFPDSASYYTITDSTTASGSGTAVEAIDWTGDGVTIELPNAIDAGDC
jgi:hypothetical protein